VELRDRLGLAPCQLRAEHVSEEVVVPVPRALAIERDQQEVLALDRLQCASGAGPFHDRVADRSVEAIEDRGPGQEALPLPGQAPEDLRTHVIDHEAVVPVEPDRRQRRAPLLLQGERGQVQADRPPLGRVGELGGLGPGGPDTRASEKAVGLRRAEREVLDADLDQPTVGAEPREPDARDRSRRQGKEGAVGDGAGDRRDRIHDQRLGEAVEIVQHEHERPGPRRERRTQSREHPRWRRNGRRRDRFEDRRLDGLDPIECDHDVSEEDNRVTIGLVDRYPCERATIALGPLGEQGGLAVPGGRGDRHDRGRVGGAQALNEVVAPHDPRSDRRSEELRLRHLELEWPASLRSRRARNLSDRPSDRPTPHRRTSLVALPVVVFLVGAMPEGPRRQEWGPASTMWLGEEYLANHPHRTTTTRLDRASLTSVGLSWTESRGHAWLQPPRYRTRTYSR
jgi:hypothetical protein